MLKATIQCSCGCGVKTDKVNDAIEHARVTGHTMSVNGEIRNIEEPKPKSEG